MSTPAPALEPPTLHGPASAPAAPDAPANAQSVPAPIASSEPTLALKRSYLELLPHSQLTELCLALDVHVPASARADVWPTDLPAAIAALVASGHTPNSSRLPAPGQVASPAQAAPGASAPPVVLAVAGPSTVTVQPAGPYTPNGTYARPSAGPSYHGAAGGPSSHPYPKPVAYGGAPERAAPKRNLNPAHPNAKLAPDELPSYEEMIVEALEACTDPTGAPPKVLFQWMEATYPLHSNFRPSASQALQKAFKRGRLNKSDSGKYTINVAWEGSTSLKRTRRPHVSATQPYTKPPTPLVARPLLSSQSVALTNPHHQPYGGAAAVYAYASQYPPKAVPKLEDRPSSQDSSIASQAVASPQPADDAASTDVPAPLPIQPKSEPMEGVIPSAPSPAPRSSTPVKLEVPPLPATAPAVPAAAASAPLSEQDRAALQAQLSLFTAQVAALEGLEDEDAEGEDDPDADGELELDRREEEEEEEEDTVPTLGAAWASQAWRAHGYVHAPDVQMAAPHVAVREEEEEEEEEEEMQLISDVACAIAS